MQAITLDSVSRVYGRIFALHRVSATFRAGRVTALVGDNGSGKTTLLTILATLEAPTDGSITYDDVGWKSFADNYRDRVGWIAHDSLVYEELTGRENLTFYADMYGTGADDSSIEGWLERVGLAEAADRRVSAYSRGMQQRLSIARALLHDPDLLLLDEPLTGLDRKGRRTVIALIDEWRRRQKLIILASHDLQTLDQLADTVAIMQRGKLARMADADDIDSVADLYREHA
jgi:heme exporter protein A